MNDNIKIALATTAAATAGIVAVRNTIKTRRQQREEASLDFHATCHAAGLMADRLRNGTAGDPRQFKSEFHNLVAFEKIAIRIK